LNIFFRKFFLPTGIILAGIAAILYNFPGVCLKQAGAIPVFIIIIFLVNGYQLKLKDFKLEKRFLKTFVWAILISLIGAPFLGKVVGDLVGLTGFFALGLVVMSSVPPTLSSGIVITEVSGGNRLWALFLTIGLNLVGIVTIPLMLKLSLHGGGDVSISPWPLFFKLLAYVLAPLLVGMLIRKITPGKDFSEKLRYIPSICVILTVWVALSASSELLMSVPFKYYICMIIGATGVHTILLAVNAMGGKFLLKLKNRENKALFFVASQKTLPVAISVLAILGDKTAPALLTCLLFHFGQLLIDSVISAKMAK
jgi:solute carrier family 10 (sodium/bile acid cotransporter), member 7